MSYQIKSTPYFRRMYNNSKRNGQLQRLREEYERIQEFNDRTIELKMRQVRLKRLFREIEEIKEGPVPLTNGNGAGPLVSGPIACNAGTSTATTRAMQRRRRQELVAPTVEQQQYLQRLDTLARAKELGKEISRRNAELAEAGAGHSLRSDLRLTTKMQAAADAKRAAADRRERAAKRISYGNAQSKQNLQRIVSSRQRRLCGGGFTGAGAAAAGSMDFCSTGSSGQQEPAAAINMSRLQRPDLTKKAMLKQRLNYGNSRSCNNMRRQCRHKQAQGQSHGQGQGSVKFSSQMNLLAGFDEEAEGDGDDDDEEQQGLELQSESSGHHGHGHMLAPYTLSSGAPTAMEDQGPPATSSEEQDDLETDMSTAPQASTSQATTTIPAQQVAMIQEDAVSNTNNKNSWLRISQALPWFKAFPRLLDGTLPVCASESISSSSSYDDLDIPAPTPTVFQQQQQHQEFHLPPFRFRKTNH
ncbi:uncharacterized protein LOC117590816 [Drosophila guanche]|uniref:Uncharacterized protein n=1 Tax=Drosophila guanche TaxID=7266 RepID=A0A3B0K4X1_DROGU|nr:uncharacterized protein LOC117590816 [Drosophila guanche]SPP89277.1 Hypothetical predicted protein [Drosophila guanche]